MKHLLAILFVLAVGASGHFHGHRLVLDRLNTSSFPLAEHHRTTPRPVRPATRLVVVMVDGLRGDVAMRLAPIRAIAARGVSAELRADFPTFTHAAIATFATGVPPKYHGVRMNFPGPTPSLDSVAARAVAAGLPVRVKTDFAPFARLLAIPDTAAVTKGDGLDFIYVGEVDVAGHRYGAASSAYHEAASNAAAVVGDIAAGLDPARDAIVVLSDHGHLNRGGHGGMEPNARSAFFVAAGGPFARGRKIDLTMSDVAPTVAVALGIDQPRHALGRPALAAFAELRASTLDLDESEDPRLASLQTWEARHERAATMRAIAAGVALALLSVVAARRWRLRAKDASASLLFGVGFLGPYVAAGYGDSWSIPRGYGGFLVETLLFAIVGLVVAWLATSKDRAVEQALMSAILLGVPYYLVSAYVGLDAAWLSGPSSTWGVMLISTLMFYGCLGLGARAAIQFGYERVTRSANVEGGGAGTLFPDEDKTCEREPPQLSRTSLRPH